MSGVSVAIFSINGVRSPWVPRWPQMMLNWAPKMVAASG